jgi:hypothetical protein
VMNDQADSESFPGDDEILRSGALSHREDA